MRISYVKTIPSLKSDFFVTHSLNDVKNISTTTREHIISAKQPYVPCIIIVYF